MKYILRSLAVIGIISASQVTASPTIPHSHITPWDHKGISATASLLQPRVRFVGCDPYPSVNHEGKVSGGLRATGRARSGCHDGSKKQVHYRGKCFTESSRSFGGIQVIGRGKVGRGKVCAHMYSYYFPKDVGLFGTGHRHDWEDIIVWTRNVNNQGERVLGVSFSRHGQYLKVNASQVERDKTRAYAIYKTTIGTHQMNAPSRDELRRLSFNGPLKVANYHQMISLDNDLIGSLSRHDFGSAEFNLATPRFAELLKRSWTNNWTNSSGQHWRP